jgi:hypothetical protein
MGLEERFAQAERASDVRIELSASRRKAPFGGACVMCSVPTHLDPVHGRQVRRLAEKVMAAFDHACDQGNLHIAEQLLQVMERLATRASTVGTDRRFVMERVLDGRQRIWQLRNASDTPAN